MTLVAGVDSSTQSCKIVIRDAATGALVRSGRAAHPEGTEVDPAAWWDALLAAIADAGGLDGGGPDGAGSKSARSNSAGSNSAGSNSAESNRVSAISVAGQQHGMVVLDVTGRVIRPALLWNDTRSAQAALDLIGEVGADEYARRTGTVPVASFTAAKLRWLRDAEPENAAHVAAVALPHDWLTWRLRGYGPVDESPLGPVLEELTTDRSDASGTSYWSPTTGGYDRDLLIRALGHDAIVPRVLEPGERAGVTAAFSASDTRPASVGHPTSIDAARSQNDGLSSRHADHAARHAVAGRESPSFSIPAGIVVGAGAGDNAGAALGLGAASGDVIVSIGTSGTVFAVTEQPTHDGTGAVAGFADASGLFLPLIATLNAARVLSSIAGVLDVDHDGLARLALEADAGAGGVVLVPYFEGERTPNLPDATASFHGLTLASGTRANIARAAIEGMLCGLADGLDAVRAVGVREQRLLLIGGAAQNPAVQAIAAQVFDAPVIIPAPGEYVADGAAVQAAWALTGARPAWPLAIAAQPAHDFRPVIREQYARHAAQVATATVATRHFT
ncbi:MAG: xylulose kinase [Microbacteriaceae bacterium]|nr:MAG: xylulose kinase [Microbacteriaceae bacterium]